MMDTSKAMEPMEAAAKPLLGVATEGFARELAAEIVGIWARETAANLPPEMVEMACITFYGPEDWRSFETWEQAGAVRDMRAAINAALAQVGEKK